MEWKQATFLSGYHDRTIFSVDWSKTGNLLVTGAADDTIRIFRETSDSTPSHPAFELLVQHSNAHTGDVNCVRWGPNADAQLLASTGDDNLVRIWQFVRRD